MQLAVLQEVVEEVEARLRQSQASAGGEVEEEEALQSIRNTRGVRPALLGVKVPSNVTE